MPTSARGLLEHLGQQVRNPSGGLDEDQAPEPHELADEREVARPARPQDDADQHRHGQEHRQHGALDAARHHDDHELQGDGDAQVERDGPGPQAVALEALELHPREPHQADAHPGHDDAPPQALLGEEHPHGQQQQQRGEREARAHEAAEEPGQGLLPDLLEVGAGRARGHGKTFGKALGHR
jgi:hypothetical protein